MNWRIYLLPHTLPKIVRQRILTALFTATAQSFQVPCPAHGRLSYSQRLCAYARFTCEQAEKALQKEEDLPALRAHLFWSAYPIGMKLRRQFAVKSKAEALALGQILYRAIGVEMRGEVANHCGRVMVTRCTYSRFYSSPVCELISALDEGVFAGLSGGGRLVFSERLTQGRPYCLAALQFREEDEK